MFYEIDGGDITPLGLSFSFENIKIIQNDCIELTYFKNHPEKILCDKIDINKDDYAKSVINSSKEFNGLHYGPLIYEKFYTGGIILAIKDTADDKAIITLLELKDFILCKTIGVISIENNPKKYRKLKFNLCDEINNYENEEWVITYNWITDYRYDNFFNVYINGKYRFQLEVIDNGIK